MSVPESKPWTFEMYTLLPEDGKRHEVIDGRHYVTAAPVIRHQSLVMRLALEIGLVVREQGEGLLLGAPCDVVFNDTNFVQPDLLYVSKERADVLTEANIQGAPDLVVEVLSPSTRKRDEILKRELYERFGVIEFWIVDPELETVKVYRRIPGAGFGRAELLERSRGASLESPLLRDFLLSLDSLFEAG